MRILQILTVSFAFTLFACITTNDPASPPGVGSKPKSERTNEDAPVPTRGMAFRHPGSLSDLGLGHSVYMRKCGQCHTHALPAELSNKDWHVVTPRMAWNANISDAEQDALLKYLLAAKSDPAQPANQPEIRFNTARPKS